MNHPMTSENPEIPEGQPTWCRVRAGGGCTLPGGFDKHGNRILVSPAVPTRLRNTRELDDLGRQVWVLPARAWSPGDTVELGPIPPTVVVRYEGPAPHSDRVVV